MSQYDLLDNESHSEAGSGHQLPMRPKPSNPSVTQDYDLIHAIQRLDLRPKRLLTSVISKVNPLSSLQDNTPSRIVITADEWSTHWGVAKKNAYRDLKDAAEALVGKRFWINNETHRQEWRHWVSGAGYKEGKGHVVVELDRKLMPYLCGPMPVFSSYKVSCVKNLKSVKSFILYERLNQFAKSGVRAVDLAELREALGSLDKTPRWADFNRWVLRGLVEDISENSNLEVYYRPIKSGRTVTSVRFNMLRKVGWEPAGSLLPN